MRFPHDPDLWLAHAVELDSRGALPEPFKTILDTYAKEMWRATNTRFDTFVRVNCLPGLNDHKRNAAMSAAIAECEKAYEEADRKFREAVVDLLSPNKTSV